MNGALDRAPLVRILADAAAGRSAVTPLTDSIPGLDVASAYDIQDDLVDVRVSAGAPIVGAKLGLTSLAKQRQMHVDSPIYGWLTSDMQIDTGAPLECGRFIQPRCEPEVAFVLGQDLVGAHISATHVLAATEYVCAAVDVLDSRFAGYAFTLSDVVADNASSAGFSLGGLAVDPRGIDLRLVGCVLEKNGELVATAAGAAVLGHPAASVAWLVRALAARDRGLRQGQIIMAGALTEAVAVAPGDTVVASFDRLGTVEMTCR